MKCKTIKLLEGFTGLRRKFIKQEIRHKHKRLISWAKLKLRFFFFFASKDILSEWEGEPVNGRENFCNTYIQKGDSYQNVY